MKKVKKIIILIILILILVIIGICSYFISNYNISTSEVVEISSQEELNEIYEGKTDFENSIIFKLFTLPFSMIDYIDRAYPIYDDINYGISINSSELASGAKSESITNNATSTTTKDYSTTNIQVENVDEADITKTDGDYIYSLSNTDVIITDVRNPEQIKIISRISENDSNSLPEDLMLYNDKLVIIYENIKSSGVYSYYNNKNTTIVKVYDITNREEPKEIKSYEIQQPYYTSRCIEGKLYVIASGNLKKENDNVITYYKEDGRQVDPGFNSIKRIKDLHSKSQTIISMIDLNNVKNPVKINSYLMNVENAYISEDNIYLLNEKYKGYKSPEISNIFGLKGIIGAFDMDEDDQESGYYTSIYKFKLLNDGSIKLDKKTEEKGKTINQFSIDEHEGNLRVALYNYEGSKIVIFDEDMKKIGETENLAEGEKMYSTRFLGDKAYLVTYKTIDPLFVIDLSDPTNPKTLGELKIPGYSTYLHPYDENHIIGIGMQTEEKVNRNSKGKVTSTTATITGMKMALFDVSDVNNPIQISDTVIGDRRTSSAILTNHKALLFSKEKELIAIPVNNYSEDFEIEASSDSNDTLTRYYKDYNKEYVSEGYFVYNINLNDGFKLKGTITHDKTKSKYTYNNNSKLLRGLYIDNNLYTISENYIKVNELESLKEISQLKIEEE